MNRDRAQIAWKFDRKTLPNQKENLYAVKDLAKWPRLAKKGQNPMPQYWHSNGF